MAKMRITFRPEANKDPQEVTATRTVVDNGWMTFMHHTGGGTREVLKLREEEIDSVERID